MEAQIDNVSLGTTTLEDHPLPLLEFFVFCQKNHLRIKLEKREFMKRKKRWNTWSKIWWLHNGWAVGGGQKRLRWNVRGGHIKAMPRGDPGSESPPHSPDISCPPVPFNVRVASPMCSGRSGRKAWPLAPMAGTCGPNPPAAP